MDLDTAKKAVATINELDINKDTPSALNAYVEESDTVRVLVKTNLPIDLILSDETVQAYSKINNSDTGSLTTIEEFDEYIGKVIYSAHLKKSSNVMYIKSYELKKTYPRRKRIKVTDVDMGITQYKQISNTLIRWFTSKENAEKFILKFY